ncbi:hypothetical protein I6E84_07445 [Psychrobacter sp. SCQQ22]|uniref:hypothetical protein n=1 Tax=Psychrobacter sp. SCQQ22 TaxID=2792059 RepID=UPI0018CCEFFC|nr:hypothetical protein [Psychrobacter sp. SCQQ22]MBH0086050.1 hypothetical protein [Psychrobacter sp. SCQQ22]
MSDKKTDIETDFEERLAKIANKKSRTRTNNDIYDRFISRVQSTEDDSRATSNIKTREKALDITATDTDTVFDFSNSNSLVEEETFNIDESLKIESDDTHTQLNSDYNKVMDSEAEMQSEAKATTYNDDWATQEAQIQEVVNEPAATAQNKLASSKKPLIIGIVFGSLLIAVIVAVLIFTGVLSTSTNTTMPDSASSTPNNTETIETEVTTNSIPAEDIESEISVDETEPSTADTPVAATKQGEATSENQGSTPNRAKATEAPLSEAASNDSQADTAISYEVFRQESQNTVYRETND